MKIGERALHSLAVRAKRLRYSVDYDKEQLKQKRKVVRELNLSVRSQQAELDEINEVLGEYDYALTD